MQRERLLRPRCPQVIDDPSGNSFVENPHAPQRDDALVVTRYRRSPQQAAALGLQVPGCWAVLFVFSVPSPSGRPELRRRG